MPQRKRHDALPSTGTSSTVLASFRALASYAGHAVVLADASGRIDFANQEASDLLAAGASDPLTGQLIQDVIGRRTGDPERAQAQFRMLAARLDATTYSLPLAGGRSLLVDFIPVFEEDVSTGSVWRFHDATRQANENLLRRQNGYLAALHDMTLALINRLDLNEMLQTVVERAGALLGTEHTYLYLLENEAEIVVRFGSGIFRAHLGFRMRRGEGIAGKVWATGQPLTIFDYDAWTGRSSNFTFGAVRSVVAVPLTSAGQVVGVIGISHMEPGHVFGEEAVKVLSQFAELASIALDNARLYQTSQTQLQELSQLYGQLSELEQLKTQMIRVAAHDLRGPLSIVSAYLSLLEDELGPDAERLKLYTDPMHRAVERMQRMTTDLLSLERIRQGREKNWESVGLRDIAERALVDHREAAELKGLALNAELDPHEVMIQGDPIQLYEAAANLIGNAIKYTPEGGCVTVHYRHGAGVALFEVQDTGLGVPEADQSRLFEAFFRVRNDDTRAIEGTGLGLYLVKTIIDMHSGEMHLKSTLGQGSIFGFTLPENKVTSDG